MNEEETNEIWKELPKKFKLSNYVISNLGKIKNKNTNHLYELSPNKDGYIYLKLLSDNNVYIKAQVQDLVTYAFKEINDGEMFVVLHKNGDKTDNRFSNLQYTFVNNMKSF